MGAIGLMKTHDFIPGTDFNFPGQCGRCGYGRYNPAHNHSRTVHSLDIPTEPPLYSVIIDRNHRAWQRVPSPTPLGTARWQVVPAHPLVLENGSSLAWPELLRKHGPLTEVFRIDDPGVAS